MNKLHHGIHPNPYEPIRTYPDPSGSIRTHPDRSHDPAVRTHSGPVRIHSGPVRIRSGPVRTFLSLRVNKITAKLPTRVSLTSSGVMWETREMSGIE